MLDVKTRTTKADLSVKHRRIEIDGIAVFYRKLAERIPPDLWRLSCHP